MFEALPKYLLQKYHDEASKNDFSMSNGWIVQNEVDLNNKKNEPKFQDH